jgi:hypothetical protein
MFVLRATLLNNESYPPLIYLSSEWKEIQVEAQGAREKALG